MLGSEADRSYSCRQQRLEGPEGWCVYRLPSTETVDQSTAEMSERGSERVDGTVD